MSNREQRFWASFAIFVAVEIAVLLAFPLAFLWRFEADTTVAILYTIFIGYYVLLAPVPAYVLHFTEGKLGDFSQKADWLVVSNDNRECFHGSFEVAKWVHSRKIPIVQGHGDYREFEKQYNMVDHGAWPIRQMELRFEELTRSAKSQAEKKGDLPYA